MRSKGFKNFLARMSEETAAADIAAVDTKLDLIKRPKHLQKGKKCKTHKQFQCEECLEKDWDES